MNYILVKPDDSDDDEDTHGDIPEPDANPETERPECDSAIAPVVGAVVGGKKSKRHRHRGQTLGGKQAMEQAARTTK